MTPFLNTALKAARRAASDGIAALRRTYLGELVEFGLTDEIFIKPKRKETEDYITGRFG